MSRSNPHENAPNPAVRWFEWNGENGVVRYYDRDKKENVEVSANFKFMLLDELGSVRGWHDASGSGIYSNEVRDTRTDMLVVKSFKGGTLAEGLYKDIKDRVNNLGGQFVANCYVAFKNGGAGLSIGSLRFKGAALGTWMEFRKAHRSELYKKAIAITGYTEGKKGRITFRMPVLQITELSAESDAQAKALDAELQEWLKGYFQRATRERVEDRRHVSDEEIAAESDDVELPPETGFEPLTDDDIPF